jgi:hypothetical protein
MTATRPPRLRLKSEVMDKLAWGRPDSRMRSLCALCHGALPDVPLMMWREDGAMVSLCDKCARDSIEVAR